MRPQSAKYLKILSLGLISSILTGCLLYSSQEIISHNDASFPISSETYYQSTTTDEWFNNNKDKLSYATVSEISFLKKQDHIFHHKFSMDRVDSCYKINNSYYAKVVNIIDNIYLSSQNYEGCFDEGQDHILTIRFYELTESGFHILDFEGAEMSDVFGNWASGLNFYDRYRYEIQVEEDEEGEKVYLMNNLEGYRDFAKSFQNFFTPHTSFHRNTATNNAEKIYDIVQALKKREKEVAGNKSRKKPPQKNSKLPQKSAPKTSSAAKSKTEKSSWSYPKSIIGYYFVNAHVITKIKKLKSPTYRFQYLSFIVEESIFTNKGVGEPFGYHGWSPSSKTFQTSEVLYSPNCGYIDGEIVEQVAKLARFKSHPTALELIPPSKPICSLGIYRSCEYYRCEKWAREMNTSNKSYIVNDIELAKSLFKKIKYR